MLFNLSILRNSIKNGKLHYDDVEVYTYRGIREEIHTDFIRCFYDFSLDELPDKMPCDFEVMDDDEYNNSVDANCDHVPFSEYLEGDDPHILVVVLPDNWEDYMEYYTVAAYTGVVDDVEFNEIGEFCSWKENGRPLFSDVDRMDDSMIHHYSSESEARAELAKLQEYYQEHIDFNEQVNLATIRYYMEDGEWIDDDPENDTEVVYQFKDITGAVIVKWAWETHVGYAREFKEICTVSKFDTCHDESLLIPLDDTYRPQCSLLFTAEEADEAIEKDTYDEELEEKIFDKNWKWTNPGFIRWFLDMGKDMH